MEYRIYYYSPSASGEKLCIHEFDVPTDDEAAKRFIQFRQEYASCNVRTLRRIDQREITSLILT